MNKILIRWVVAFFLCGICYSTLALSPRKESYSDRVYFASNSQDAKAENWKLDVLACRGKGLQLELVIVVGHADISEKNAQQLSERRAEQIRKQLISLGIPEKKAFFEGKGSKQPVSAEEPELNRRVEIEVIGIYEKEVNECEAGPQRIFSDLSLKNALVISHSLIRDGLSTPHSLISAAINLKRADLLGAFLTDPITRPFDSEDRISLMREAITRGNAESVEKLITFGIKIDEFKKPGLPLIWLVCSSRSDEAEQVRMGKMLIAWGESAEGVSKSVSGREKSALLCAAQGSRLILADLLLAAGENPNLPEINPPLLAGVSNPSMVRKLISAGADSKVKSKTGGTLFHLFHFATPEDVEWIAGLNLDINVKDKEERTPLHFAVRYATPEILEAFVVHGASIDQKGLIEATTNNLPGLLWLLNKGAPLDKADNTALMVASRGDEAVPVIEALYRRGASVKGFNQRGDTPLRTAIAALAPTLVERLVAMGAIDLPADAYLARLYAEGLPVWSDAERQQRKNRIVEILKAEEERLQNQ